MSWSSSPCMPSDNGWDDWDDDHASTPSKGVTSSSPYNRLDISPHTAPVTAFQTPTRRRSTYRPSSQLRSTPRNARASIRGSSPRSFSPLNTNFITVIPDNPNCPFDIAITSSDGNQYLAHRTVLSLASAKFASMMSASRCESAFNTASSQFPLLNVSPNYCEASPGSPANSLSHSHSGYCMYTFPEDASTIHIFLYHLYHQSCPIDMKKPSGSGDDFPDPSYNTQFYLIDVAEKYELTSVVIAMCTGLLDIADNIEDYETSSTIDFCSLAPRVFIIACRIDCESLARRAAYLCLRGGTLDVCTLWSLVDDNDSLVILINYYREVVEAVLQVLDIYNDNGSATHFRATAREAFECTSCADDERVPMARWWSEYTKKASRILRGDPVSGEIYSLSFFNSIYEEALNCIECSREAFGRWAEFQPSLKKEIDKAIASVSAESFSLKDSLN
ncbi:hypothetical protein EW145_g222 [Phellinidium pouzarii]|uniref:BTB domain-containing protein n=1 Tax=Phellinidium pouzarii TaxID=167371 RepID=A0A4S4LL17_9AGAM|nr:hypothetical protein EW145_g222 [Phellinidium pouzarii]